MTAVAVRVSPAAKPLPARFHGLCDRCGWPVNATNAIPLTCFGCTEAARKLWPDAPVVRGEVSGT